MAKRTGRSAPILSLTVFALATVALSACDARLREIRAALTDDERARFDRGAALSSPCWACHDFYSTQNKLGPHLSGLYGRRAGESTFGGYSAALRRSGIVWDDRTLDAFLADPRQLVPGTTMLSPGVPSAADREALRSYIARVTAPR